MRETALGLAARGFKVFPITAGAKTPPLITSWQTKATTDTATIESWWTQWPNANVGIHCDGLVVIDVDPKNGGRESLAALEQEITLEATYEVDTPSGGIHVYYRCPAGAAATAAGLAGLASTTSSCMVCQRPQSEQRPVHLDEFAPHSVQT